MSIDLFSGIGKILIAVAVFGAIAGFAISSSDLMHFNTSAATARAMEQQTQSRAAKDAVDIGVYKTQKAQEQEKAALDLETYKTNQRLEMENQQRLREQQLQTQRQLAEQELAAQREQLSQQLVIQRAKADQELVLGRLSQYGLLAILAAGMLVLCMGTVYFLIQTGRSRVLMAQAQVTDQRQRELERRAEMIRQARANERIFRRAEIKRSAADKITPITQAKSWKDPNAVDEPAPHSDHP